MGKKVKYEEIVKYAHDIFQELQKDDLIDGEWTLLILNDGSEFYIKDSILEENGDWIITWSKNHGMFIYHKHDLKRFEVGGPDMESGVVLQK